jgi:hypothetical protein
LFGLKNFQVSEQNIYYYKDSVLGSYNTKFLSTYDSTLAKPFPKQANWNNGIIYKMYTDSLVWE